MEILTVKIIGGGYLVNGNTYVPQDEQNNDYQDIKKWCENNVPESEFTEEEIRQTLINHYTRVVDYHIQSKISEYNKINGTAFTNVHHCANYKDAVGYTHRQFCSDVWVWNVQVWETARGVQTEVISGARQIPTDEELITLLPEYTGVLL